jgi:hypothetical protein
MSGVVMRRLPRCRTFLSGQSSTTLGVVPQQRLASSEAAAKHSGVAPFRGRYGLGGRSSNSGITATVFGAYGFVGRYFINELGACGSRVYVPFRGCEMEPRHLKPMFDLGQVRSFPYFLWPFPLKFYSNPLTHSLSSPSPLQTITPTARPFALFSSRSRLDSRGD